MLHETRFSTRPLYLQVRDILVERISGGQWKPGSAIPNEIQLSRELGVSVGTVRKSLDCMESEHLVSRKQGRGTFVNDQSSELFSQRFSNLRDGLGRHVEGQLSILSASSGVAEDIECRRLDLRSGESVLRVTRVRRAHAPYMYEKVVLPLSRFAGLTETSLGTCRIVTLAQEYGILLGRAEERIAPAAAACEAAAALELPEGELLLQLDRVVYSIDGRPVEWRVGMCNLEGFNYVVDIG